MFGLFWRSFPSSREIIVAITFQLFAAKCSAVALPIPLDAPVIIMFFKVLFFYIL